jgi:hypothetical protein
LAVSKLAQNRTAQVGGLMHNGKIGPSTTQNKVKKSIKTAKLFKNVNSSAILNGMSPTKVFKNVNNSTILEGKPLANKVLKTQKSSTVCNKKPPTKNVPVQGKKRSSSIAFGNEENNSSDKRLREGVGGHSR